jgi:hypothetical protein
MVYVYVGVEHDVYDQIHRLFLVLLNFLSDLWHHPPSAAVSWFIV